MPDKVEKDWADRLLRFLNISKRTAEIGGAIVTAIAAIAIAIATARGFMANANIRNPNEVLEMLGLYDATTERVQTILRSVMRRTDSDRAFVFFYLETEKRVIESVFYDGYQQTGEGLVPIPQGHYPLGSGLSKARYDSHLNDRCTPYVVEEIDQKDPLAKAFIKSNTQFAMSCPFYARLDRKEVLAAIAVEYTKLPFIDEEEENGKKVKIQRELLESSSDIVRVMAKSKLGK
ncbi:MAG: hypothetical protein ACRCYP_01560 [Alphaproteobacteria bacterium]